MGTPTDTDVLVIGAGQAGLSAAYFLQRFGFADRFRIVDHAPSPGGAWQFRWPSLTLAAANHVHDLPGFGLIEALGVDCDEFPASTAVADYFRRYEMRFGIDVERAVDITAVRRIDDDTSDGFVATRADGSTITSRTIVNATGTWDRPFIPFVPGAGTFTGRQLHTHDYRGPEHFRGQRVLVVGAGISAVQLLIEIARRAEGATTFWCSRTRPRFSEKPFTPVQGRAAVARVDERVRAGLPPGSVVSVTGLPVTSSITEARRAGILDWRPMFDAIAPDGVRWDDDTPNLAVDVILWCTGFRYSLDHLAPLHLRGPGGGIVMTGRLATTVAADPRIQLLGYGPSASTIGANRAGREAARLVVDQVSS
ncbi:NAD(P)-binding domain-containing protein [Williamsia sterculiae]|uniref:Pyridine nucleotide-disulphide oxidoreductase n=1 Tax=Williamsia sterculiae TaxID=1344003 RepID=A0A1N7DF64_9NOCA|nr:NAD(P)-binding domain-containing protein [Williamsia sterculiae]SIR74456.1 Pyridine nucleotide-disulphide oxidoreductase [Williamsia sterculiae]